MNLNNNKFSEEVEKIDYLLQFTITTTIITIT